MLIPCLMRQKKEVLGNKFSTKKNEHTIRPYFRYRGDGSRNISVETLHRRGFFLAAAAGPKIPVRQKMFV
jgi:hypothetical protein